MRRVTIAPSHPRVTPNYRKLERATRPPRPDLVPPNGPSSPEAPNNKSYPLSNNTG